MPWGMQTVDKQNQTLLKTDTPGGRRGVLIYREWPTVPSPSSLHSSRYSALIKWYSLVCSLLLLARSGQCHTICQNIPL